MAEVFNQTDGRWSGDTLGVGSLTVGKAGCYVATGAQSLVHGGYDTDPGRLNQQLIDLGRFAGSAVSSDAFLDGIGGAQFVETLWYPGPADLNAPKDTYEDEYYVEIWIDNNPDYTHFLRWVSGHTPEDFTVDDPEYGDEVVLGSRYGGGVQTIIQKMVHYRVPNPTPPPAEVVPPVVVPQPDPPVVVAPVEVQIPVTVTPVPVETPVEIPVRTPPANTGVTHTHIEDVLIEDEQYIISWLGTTQGKLVLKLVGGFVGYALAHLGLPHFADWTQTLVGVIVGGTVSDWKNPFIANSKNDV